MAGLAELVKDDGVIIIEVPYVRDLIDQVEFDTIYHQHLCYGFIANLAFNPALTEYSARYEETQGFSPTFNAFHRALAERLIARYDLHGKDIVEIGCGKGEFLMLLCELGGNRGVGFDPGCRSGSCSRPRTLRLHIDFYFDAH